MIFDTISDRVQGYMLKKASNQLHIPHMNIWLDIEVISVNGRILKKVHQRAKSWNRNAYNIIFSVLSGISLRDATFGAGLLSVKEIGGNIDNNQLCYPATSAYIAAGSDNTVGIVVGTGVGTESFDGFTLGTPIAPGNATGQLYTLPSESNSRSYGALTMTNTLIRYFNNNSGSIITVGEVGLIAQSIDDSGVRAHFMTCRDKLTPTISVPDTAQLKATYTINLVYPS